MVIGIGGERDRTQVQRVDDRLVANRRLHRREALFQKRDIGVNNVVSYQDIRQLYLLDQVSDLLGSTHTSLRAHLVCGGVHCPPGTDEVFALSVPLYVKRAQSFHPILLVA
ncbi:hypothetical protein [Candidatus Cryosericum odellii]